MFVPFDLWSHFFAELRRWFLFFYRLGENGRAFLSTAGRCLLYSLLLEISFRFFSFFIFHFISIRFFIHAFLSSSWYIYSNFIHNFKNATGRNKKNTSPSRFSAVSRYILDRYYIVSGSDWKSPFFRRFQRQTDRPTDRPPDQTNFTVSGNGSVTARRYASSNKVPAIPSVGRSDFYACSACSTRVDRGRSKRRDARASRPPHACRVQIWNWYISIDTYIYISIIVHYSYDIITNYYLYKFYVAI